MPFFAAAMSGIYPVIADKTFQEEQMFNFPFRCRVGKVGHQHFLPFGQAYLLCYKRLAVHSYSCAVCASQLSL